MAIASIAILSQSGAAGAATRGVRHDDKSSVEQGEAGHDRQGRQFGRVQMAPASPVKALAFPTPV